MEEKSTPPAASSVRAPFKQPRNLLVSLPEHEDEPIALSPGKRKPSSPQSPRRLPSGLAPKAAFLAPRQRAPSPPLGLRASPAPAAAPAAPPAPPAPPVPPEPAPPRRSVSDAPSRATRAQAVSSPGATPSSPLPFFQRGGPISRALGRVARATSSALHATARFLTGGGRRAAASAAAAASSEVSSLPARRRCYASARLGTRVSA